MTALSEFPLTKEADRQRRGGALHRAKKHGNPTAPLPQLATIWRRQGGLCAYCLQPMDATFHLDHVIPIVKGGGTVPNNCVLACAPCNLEKHDSVWNPSIPPRSKPKPPKPKRKRKRKPVQSWEEFRDSVTPPAERYAAQIKRGLYRRFRADPRMRKHIDERGMIVP